MTDSISLTGISVFAHHGVLDHERIHGQTFLVDVRLDADLTSASQSDDLKDTIDYGSLARRIHERVAGERWDLIERVAERVADLVLDDPRVESVEVTVHKPAAPIPVEFEDVAVTVRRSR